MVHFLELQLLLMTSAPADGLGATKETPLRGAIRNSLAEWTKCALGPLNQEPTAHHKLLIRELEDISTGANTRLIVLMPPGSAKSTYASVLYPAWWFTQHPETSIIAVSHTASLSDHFGLRIRNLIADHQLRLGYRLM